VKGALRRFGLEDLPCEPWRNGGGRTRVVAADPPGDQFAWRVSVADVDRDGPFSLLPGIDRCAVLIGGEQLRLLGDDRSHLLRDRGDQCSFAGEAVLQARLEAGAVRLWNVMTRRGHAEACTRLVGAEPLSLARPGVLVLMVLQGRYALDGGEPLPAGAGCVVSAPSDAMLAPLDAGSVLLRTRIALR
jgi:environmental stress-induced protein Ves